MNKKILESTTFRRKSACGWVYLVCSHEGGKLSRVQVELGKSGTCANSVMSAITDLINEMLYVGGKVKYIIKALEGHECHKRSCCVDIISKLLKEMEEKYENTEKD